MIKHMTLSVEPNKGLGLLRFRASPEEAQAYLGPPDKVDQNADPAVFGLGYYYERLRLDVLFHTDAILGRPHALSGPLRLALFTTSCPDLTLWGVRIINLTEEDVLPALATRGMGDLEYLEPEPYPEHLRDDVRIIRSRSLKLELHFCRGRLQNCQWGILPL